MHEIETLNQQIAELSENKRLLEQDLGKILYDESKSNPSLRVGHESEFEAIDSIEADIEGLNKEIARIKEEAEAAAKANADEGPTPVCPACGKSCSGDDRFCSRCGTPLFDEASEQEAEAPEKQLVCIKCGKPVNAEDLFCMSCGAKQSKQ